MKVLEGKRLTRLVQRAILADHNTGSAISETPLRRVSWEDGEKVGGVDSDAVLMTAFCDDGERRELSVSDVQDVVARLKSVQHATPIVSSGYITFPGKEVSPAEVLNGFAHN
jgi:hypothetical protein